MKGRTLLPTVMLLIAHSVTVTSHACCTGPDVVIWNWEFWAVPNHAVRVHADEDNNVCLSEWAWFPDGESPEEYDGCVYWWKGYSKRSFSFDSVGEHRVEAWALGCEWDGDYAVICVATMGFGLESPPAPYIPVNDDDDDHNGRMDHHNDGPFPKNIVDDDLVPLYLSVDSPRSSGDYTHLCLVHHACMRVWSEPNLTGLLIGGADLGEYMPAGSWSQTYYVEGVSSSDIAELWWYYFGIGPGYGLNLEGWNGTPQSQMKPIVVHVDMDMEDVADDWSTGGDPMTDETTPGGFIPLGEFKDLLVRRVLPINVSPPNWPEVTISAIYSGNGRIRLWNSSKTQMLSLPHTFSCTQDTYFCVEGHETSSDPCDITLVLTHPYTQFQDKINLTVFDTEKIPLGYSADLATCIIGKVYVPTRYGGTLTLAGAPIKLFYTDGSDLTDGKAIQILKGELDAYIVDTGNPCVYNVPYDNHGWYYVKVTAATPTMISSSFVQTADTGEAWDCYWWPTLEDANRPDYEHLYDVNGPLDKYDQWHVAKYGGSSPGVRAWEYSSHRTTDPCEYWCGHCDVRCAVVINETEPGASVEEGISFSARDKQGLLVAIWEEFSDESESEDSGPDEMHDALEFHVKRDGEKAAVDVYHDEYEYPNQGEVWNYVVNGYTAQMWEKDDTPGLVEVVLHLDLQSDPQWEYRYDYWLQYSTAGEASGGDWIYPETGPGKERRPDLLWWPTTRNSPQSGIDPSKALDIVY